MGKTLYIEGSSGISGDMTVAALLDLGADQAALEAVLNALPVSGFEISVSRVKKSGIDACDFNVILEHDNHDHDMEYLHGHSHDGDTHGHEHEHCHEHEHHDEHEHHHHEHEHNHEHEHEHHHHDHVHAALPGILAVIDGAQMSERAKKIARDIFMILAKAESKAHGVPMDQVHFHEVGAVDSIVDVISVAFCLDNLDITQVIVPDICEGRGTVRCQHGVMPVPVPAVVNIAQAHQLTLQITEVEGELVTPTGAAIVAAVKTSDRLPEKFVIDKIGIGAGKRNYSRPSMLRLMLIHDTENAAMPCDDSKDEIYILETNLDDCTGECLGYLMDRLFEAGARDAHYTPVFMKKNRPGYLLTVICDEAHIKVLEQMIFEETTTIGIRRLKAERTILPRKIIEVDTPLGKADVKVCTLPDGRMRIYPEYESAAALAEQNHIGIYDAMELIKRVAETACES